MRRLIRVFIICKWFSRLSVGISEAKNVVIRGIELLIWKVLKTKQKKKQQKKTNKQTEKKKKKKAEPINRNIPTVKLFSRQNLLYSVILKVHLHKSKKGNKL